MARRREWRRPSPVAQISNLLYRGFAIRSLPDSAGLRPVGHAAESNSAIQQIANLRYGVAAVVVADVKTAYRQ